MPLNFVNFHKEGNNIHIALKYIDEETLLLLVSPVSGEKMADYSNTSIRFDDSRGPRVKYSNRCGFHTWTHKTCIFFSRD